MIFFLGGGWVFMQQIVFKKPNNINMLIYVVPW